MLFHPRQFSLQNDVVGDVPEARVLHLVLRLFNISIPCFAFIAVFVQYLQDLYMTYETNCLCLHSVSAAEIEHEVSELRYRLLNQNRPSTGKAEYVNALLRIFWHYMSVLILAVWLFLQDFWASDTALAGIYVCISQPFLAHLTVARHTASRPRRRSAMK